MPSSFVNEDDQGSVSWNNHVALALWADIMVVAPATANTLSKMAHGQSDNLLLVTYLSAKCPVFIAPAMDLDMYKHKSTKESLDRLVSFGHAIIPAEDGLLASGLSGAGRMAEPEHIMSFIVNYLREGQPLFGKRVIVFLLRSWRQRHDENLHWFVLCRLELPVNLSLFLRATSNARHRNVRDARLCRITV